MAHWNVVAIGQVALDEFSVRRRKYAIEVQKIPELSIEVVTIRRAT